MQTVPDQALMAEAADTIERLRNDVLDRDITIRDLQDELAREEEASERAMKNARELWEQGHDDLEAKIEFLEADRARLSALIHPNTPGCDVVAGRCHWCDSAVKRRDEDVRELIDAVITFTAENHGYGEVAVTLKKALEKVRKGLQ